MCVDQPCDTPGSARKNSFSQPYPGKEWFWKQCFEASCFCVTPNALFPSPVKRLVVLKDTFITQLLLFLSQSPTSHQPMMFLFHLVLLLPLASAKPQGFLEGFQVTTFETFSHLLPIVINNQSMDKKKTFGIVLVSIILWIHVLKNVSFSDLSWHFKCFSLITMTTHCLSALCPLCPT